MSASPARLILFAREPRPGKVKTRLIPALGEDGAAKLYEGLLKHAVETASTLEGIDKELWYDAGDGEPAICRRLATQYGLALHCQPEGDLGARMYLALKAPPPAADYPALLIGSDCPGYSSEYFGTAIAALADHDAVIGPSVDGGYVLIGLNRADRRLFEDIEWSTGTVLDATRCRLRDLGWRWKELPPLHDIDRPADLERLTDSGIVSGN